VQINGNTSVSNQNPATPKTKPRLIKTESVKKE
jgi:hypothetical protein